MLPGCQLCADVAAGVCQEAMWPSASKSWCWNPGKSSGGTCWSSTCVHWYTEVYVPRCPLLGSQIGGMPREWIPWIPFFVWDICIAHIVHKDGVEHCDPMSSESGHAWIEAIWVCMLKYGHICWCGGVWVALWYPWHEYWPLLAVPLALPGACNIPESFDSQRSYPLVCIGNVQNQCKDWHYLGTVKELMEVCWDVIRQ